MIPDDRNLVIDGLQALHFFCLSASEVAMEEIKRVPDGE